MHLSIVALMTIVITLSVTASLTTFTFLIRRVSCLDRGASSADQSIRVFKRARSFAAIIGVVMIAAPWILAYTVSPDLRALVF